MRRCLSALFSAPLLLGGSCVNLAAAGSRTVPEGLAAGITPCVSDQLLWIILAVLFLGPVVAGIGYGVLRRLLGGASWLEWGLVLGLGFGAWRWLAG